MVLNKLLVSEYFIFKVILNFIVLSTLTVAPNVRTP